MREKMIPRPAPYTASKLCQWVYCSTHSKKTSCPPPTHMSRARSSLCVLKQEESNGSMCDNRARQTLHLEVPCKLTAQARQTTHRRFAPLGSAHQIRWHTAQSQKYSKHGMPFLPSASHTSTHGGPMVIKQVPSN